MKPFNAQNVASRSRWNWPLNGRGSACAAVWSAPVFVLGVNLSSYVAFIGNDCQWTW